MPKTFNLKLITPEETLYDGEAIEVILPTKMGEIGVLAGHERLVTILDQGEIRVKTAEGELSLASLGGFAEINPESVKILSDSAVRSEKIDAIAAEEAKEKAEQLLSQAKDDIEMAEASAALEKALLHIKIANRKRKHH